MLLLPCRWISKQRYKRGRIGDIDNEPIMNGNGTLLSELYTPIRSSFTPRSSNRIRTNAVRQAESQLEESLPGGDVTVRSIKKIVQEEYMQEGQDIESYVVDKLEAHEKSLRKEFNSTLQQVSRAASLDNEAWAKHLGERVETMKRSHKEEIRILKDEHKKLEANLRGETMDRVRHFEEQVQAIKTSHEEEVKAITTSHEEETRDLKDRFHALEQMWREDAQARAIKASQEEASLDSRLKEFEEKMKASHDEEVKAVRASHDEEVRGLKERFDKSEARLIAEVETNEAFRREIEDMNLNVITLGHEHRVEEIKTQTDEIKELTKEKGKFEYQIQQLELENAELKLEKEQMQENFDELKLENGQMRKKFDEAMAHVCSQVQMHKDMHKDMHKGVENVISRVCSRVEEWGPRAPLN